MLAYIKKYKDVKMPAIKVDNLNKIYKLYDSRKDRLKESMNPFKKKYHRDFYALKDVSFEIQKGETVGIIGKNGSGKSTLLKIITGLIAPTSGHIEVDGKVSALIELGAGFNPEYTGIENIYLNGTIMGFSKQEIDEKLDDIIAFADIGDYIHQPVKMYSSGMHIRLAFAVSINVEPEILIIDEALAVGDIRFQQKCYRKINDFRDNKKTILFCTHDTGAVLNFCTSCLWISNGNIMDYGETEIITNAYQAYMYYDQEVKTELPSGVKDLKENKKQILPWQSVSDCNYFGEGGAHITDVCFYLKDTDEAVNTLKGGEKVVLGVRAKVNDDLNMPIIGFNFKNSHGIVAFGTNTYQERMAMEELLGLEMIEVFFTFIFPPLTNGTYSVDVALADGTQKVHIQNCWKYDVLAIKVENIGEKHSFGYLYLSSNDISVAINKVNNLY